MERDRYPPLPGVVVISDMDITPGTPPLEELMEKGPKAIPHPRAQGKSRNERRLARRGVQVDLGPTK